MEVILSYCWSLSWVVVEVGNNYGALGALPPLVLSSVVLIYCRPSIKNV